MSFFCINLPVAYYVSQNERQRFLHKSNIIPATYMTLFPNILLLFSQP